MKNFRNKVATLVAVLSVAAVTSAQAALDAGVTTGVSDAKTDGATLIGLLAGAGASLFIIHKLLKRFGVSI